VQAAVRAVQVSAEERLLALRLTLAGRGPLHHAIVSNREAIRAQLAASIGEASAGRAWLEKVRIKVTAPLDLPRLAERDDPIGLLIRSIESLEADPVMLQSLAESVLSDLGQKLPAELRGSDRRLGPGFPCGPGRRAGHARERLLAAIAAEDTP
jgi:exonuclease SbcD